MGSVHLQRCTPWGSFLLVSADASRSGVVASIHKQKMNMMLVELAHGVHLWRILISFLMTSSSCTSAESDSRRPFLCEKESLWSESAGITLDLWASRCVQRSRRMVPRTRCARESSDSYTTSLVDNEQSWDSASWILRHRGVSQTRRAAKAGLHTQTGRAPTDDETRPCDRWTAPRADTLNVLGKLFCQCAASAPALQASWRALTADSVCCGTYA